MSHLPIYQDPDTCSRCGGICCKQAPGITSPDEWGAPDAAVMTARMRDALATGRWTIDRWEAEPWRDEEPLRHAVMFMRPAIKGREGERHDHLDAETEDDDFLSRMTLRSSPPSYPCTFHGRAGCELHHDARPLECRALEPDESFHCTPRAGGRRERALEWAAYQDAVRAASNPF
jgi:Fe-S-cluster containining protein